MSYNLTFLVNQITLWNIIWQWYIIQYLIGPYCNECHDDFSLTVKLRRHIRSGPPKPAPATCINCSLSVRETLYSTFIKYCIVLYCSILYCTVLCFTTLYCTINCYNYQYCTLYPFYRFINDFTGHIFLSIVPPFYSISYVK